MALNMNANSSALKVVAVRQRNPEHKRTLLLKAARDLFLTQGFAATSTVQIARRAGVSEGILFHHFGSKKGLFERLADDFAHAAAQATMPYGDQQITEEDVVRGAFDFAESNPALYDLLNGGEVQLADLNLTAYNNVIVDTIAANLEMAMAAGRVRRGNVRIMAELQFAVVDASYRAWLGREESERTALREEYILEAVRCMRAMLAPTESQTPGIN